MTYAIITKINDNVNFLAIRKRSSDRYWTKDTDKVFIFDYKRDAIKMSKKLNFTSSRIVPYDEGSGKILTDLTITENGYLRRVNLLDLNEEQYNNWLNIK